mgnify:CR=1 FL=1
MTGNNSILFEFFSVIDKELSAILFIIDNFSLLKDANIFDENKVYEFSKYSLDRLKLKRMYDCNDIFSSLLKDQSIDYKKILNFLYDKYEESILVDKYIVFTTNKSLISAYNKVADGIIKCNILCSNNIERNISRKYFPSAKVIISKIEDINCDSFARFVLADATNGKYYNINNPSSIILMNFRDNFAKDNIEYILPELIISLGDINEIKVSTAYNEPIEIHKG